MSMNTKNNKEIKSMELFRNGVLASVVKYYNDKGQILELNEYNDQKEIVIKVNHEYDNKGNQIFTEIDYFKENKVETIKRKYDKKGNCIEIITRCNGYVTRIQNMEYVNNRIVKESDDDFCTVYSYDDDNRLVNVDVFSFYDHMRKIIEEQISYEDNNIIHNINYYDISGYNTKNNIEYHDENDKIIKSVIRDNHGDITLYYEYDKFGNKFVRHEDETFEFIYK